MLQVQQDLGGVLPRVSNLEQNRLIQESRPFLDENSGLSLAIKPRSFEFPDYDGSTDPTPSIYKVNQFFTSNRVPESHKIAIVSCYLYGDALR